MTYSAFFRRALGALVASGCLTPAVAQVSVTTFHNDLAGTGQNTQETILTPANVNSTQFGKLFSVPVVGVVYAQPLYLWATNIAGGTHNVLYIVTEHDNVYAIDADTGTIYQQVSLIPSGGSTVSTGTATSDLPCTDLVPEIGITGTPVIDPVSGTLYVVAKSKLSSGAIVQYLHALDVGTLTEKFGGPVQIQASVPGNGLDSSGGVLTFNSKQENQRGGLALTNGHLIITWGSHCDVSPWHGWAMSYNATTLMREAAFNATPNGTQGEGGVWMSGAAPAVDASGNIYLATGNGAWDGSANFGDSILKLGPPANGSFPVLDYFTPFDQGALDSGDIDLGSGGAVLLPPLASGTQYLAQQGKIGTIVLLDTSNLGKYCPNLTPACTNTDPQIAEEIQGASAGIWGSPAYWNGNLYWVGANDSINAYSFNGANSPPIAKTPSSHTAQTFAFTAPTPVVSSNGTSNGILWGFHGLAHDNTCDGGTAHCLGLFAYDATNLAKLLYASSQAPSGRDDPGTPVKFEKPIVVNGKVYLGTETAVTAFGLLAGSPAPAAAPTFQPPPGTYTAAQPVTLNSTTSGATIYYTTNGTTPSTSSTVYTGPITVSSSLTIEAIAVASGFSPSPVASGAYVINISGTTEVSLAGSANVVGMGINGSAVPNGGVDGNGFAYSATLLGTSLTWNGNTYAFGSGGVADAASNTTVPLPAGSFTTLSLLGTGVDGNQLNQTFTVNYSDGTSTSFTQSLSDWFSPQNYAGETKVLAMPYRLTPSGALDNRTFNLYGYSFALNSAKTVSSLTLPKNRHVVVLAVDVSGPTNSPPPPPPAAAPTFQPPPGTYTAAQPVTLSSTTAGVSIFYTTNGTTPSVNSTRYTGAITVSSSTTLEAIAVANGFSSSSVSTAAYVINIPGSATEVSLAGVANVDAMVNNGSAVPNGGVDGNGFAYSATLLGTSLTWNGNTYGFGSAGVADAASNTTIPLSAGSYTTLSLLATAVNANQPNQTFTVNYSDGTSTSFTQSLSDWFSPQSYAGESEALVMAYRLTSNGALDNRTFYLFGYSFTLNSAKTVTSLTLPKNRNVVVLAVDLSGATNNPPPPPPAAAPTFQPPPGTYTAAQPVTLNSTTAGASIFYTTNGTAPSVSSTPYTGAITVSSTTTIEAIAVASGFSQSSVAKGSYVINIPGSTTEVSLAGSANVVGIGINGSAVPSGGVDGNGFAYSATLLGTSLSWNGNTYTFGSGGVVDAASNTTIPLPAGSYTTLSLLGTGVDGNQANQTFTVNYSDGTSTTFTQSLSDWFSPQTFAGESEALVMAYRLTPSGALDNRTFYLYGYAFPLNGAKIVTSLTLPKNAHVVVLAVDLSN